MPFQAAHSMAKDHPDWLQRKINGEPALFGGGTAFWIREGDEDVWITPFAKEWRKIYMERVRQIAGTGIDGVYVDIPYWMTHFDRLGGHLGQLSTTIPSPPSKPRPVSTPRPI